VLAEVSVEDPAGTRTNTTKTLRSAWTRGRGSAEPGQRDRLFGGARLGKGILGDVVVTARSLHLEEAPVGFEADRPCGCHPKAEPSVPVLDDGPSTNTAEESHL
jgi:hypothetical protein